MPGTLITRHLPFHIRTTSVDPDCTHGHPHSRVQGHVLHDQLGKLRALHLGGARQHAVEVVGDGAVGDGGVHPLDDQVGGGLPPHMPQHHLPGQDDRSRIDHVHVGILGGSSVGGFEDGVAGLVVDVAPRGDADPPDLSGEGIAEIVPIQVHGRHDVKLSGPGQDLLEGDVGDGVADEELGLPCPLPEAVVQVCDHALHLFQNVCLLGLSHHVESWLDQLGVLQGLLNPGIKVGKNPTLSLRHDLVPVLRLGQVVAPVPEPTFSVLHDVSFVDQRDTLVAMLQGVHDGGSNQPLRPLTGHGFDPICGRVREPNLFGHPLLLEPGEELPRRLAVGLELDPSVDVLCVLTEDDHIHILRGLDRGGHPLEVPHGAEAHVQVEDLPQSNVQGPDSTPDRRRQGALDPDQVLLVGLYGLIGKPIAGLPESLLSSQNLHPLNLPATAVSLLNSPVEHNLRSTPNIRTSAITFNVWDDGVVWHN
mmetsp:Transcript_81655/g.144015  ORF Transcript_81655/g.144015 Transcript_81655/m.144015 type:complete len:477 (+) Transcript_81655:583-2013(+)